MSIAPPPTRGATDHDALEALIKEARERQRRRRMYAAAAVAVLAAVGIGLGASRGGGGSPPQPAMQGGGAEPASARWCQAPATPAWRSLTTQHLVPLPPTTTVYPFALGGDGRSFFATVYSKHGFSGVARIDPSSGQVQGIKAFSYSRIDQATGSFDGRWLVWTETPGKAVDAGRSTTWAWDSRTGRVWKIGNGDETADVRDGVAAWTHGKEIHFYDLRTRHDLLLRPRHAGGPRLFAGHLAAWAAPLDRAGDTKTYAVSSLTGRPTRLPRALRTAKNFFTLGTDGEEIAYSDGKSLWWSPSVRQQPEKFATARGFRWLPYPLHVAGRYLGFDQEPGLFLADTRLHRYVRIGRGYGAVLSNSRDVLVFWPASTSTAPFAPMSIAFIPFAGVPTMPPCAA
jgi:hypothetical protein